MFYELIAVTLLRVKYYYPQFTDEETETQRVGVINGLKDCTVNCSGQDSSLGLPESNYNSLAIYKNKRDGMGREEGGGFGMGNTCIPVADSF